MLGVALRAVSRLLSKPFLEDGNFLMSSMLCGGMAVLKLVALKSTSVGSFAPKSTIPNPLSSMLPFNFPNFVNDLIFFSDFSSKTPSKPFPFFI